jgi:hypothetical protein
LKSFRESPIVLLVLKYCVHEPLLAILRKPGMPAEIMTIQPGSVITLKGDVNQFGFVDVHCGDQMVKVFMLDIEKKADRVEGQAG